MPRKGQSFYDVSDVTKLKKSQQENLKSRYNWTLAEPYLDCIISNGSRNRKVKFITLREFKTMIESGCDLIDIKKQGVSKHLSAFFSALLQNKISISREEFEQDYKSGKTLDEISKKYKISRDNITFVRQIFDIKATGPTYQNRKRTETPLTQRQKEIMYGSMMGDAGKQGSVTSSIKFKHGLKQKDYLLWKYKEFENVASPHSLQGHTVIDKRYNKENETWVFYTTANSDVEDCVKEFYKDGVKEVSDKILDALTPLSIAVWYMDDGCTDWSVDALVNRGHNVLPECEFCTDSFNIDSCNRIAKWFEDKWGIKSHIRHRGKVSLSYGYRIIIDSCSVNKFLDMIRPYVLPLLSYKVNLNNYMKRVDYEDAEISFVDLVKAVKNNNFLSLSMDMQDKYVIDFVKNIQKRGFRSVFPTPNLLSEDLHKIIAYNTEILIRECEICFSTLGNQFVISHFPNFWVSKAKASLSIQEIINNKVYIEEIVREILIEDGIPQGRQLWNKLNRYRGNKAISGFMPCVAKAIYNKYCKENSKVFDPCAGYGGRMTGATSSNNVLSYTGCEVNMATYSGLCNLSDNIKKIGKINKDIVVNNQDAVVFMNSINDKTFDFSFTSFPYFNAEEYDVNQSQSYKQYVNYSDWFEQFLIKCIKEMIRISNKVVVNIANSGGYKIADDLRKFMYDNNIYYQEHRLRIPKFGGGRKYEPLFIFN